MAETFHKPDADDVRSAEQEVGHSEHLSPVDWRLRQEAKQYEWGAKKDRERAEWMEEQNKQHLAWQQKHGLSDAPPEPVDDAEQRRDVARAQIASTDSETDPEAKPREHVGKHRMQGPPTPRPYLDHPTVKPATEDGERQPSIVRPYTSDRVRDLSEPRLPHRQPGETGHLPSRHLERGPILPNVPDAIGQSVASEHSGASRVADQEGLTDEPLTPDGQVRDASGLPERAPGGHVPQKEIRRGQFPEETMKSWRVSREGAADDLSVLPAESAPVAREEAGLPSRDSQAAEPRRGPARPVERPHLDTNAMARIRASVAAERAASQPDTEEEPEEDLIPGMYTPEPKERGASVGQRLLGRIRNFGRRRR